jgi:NAD(P)H-quinone oxidoreductase subunit 5
MHAGLVNAGGIAVALWLPVLVQAPYLLHALFALGAATALLGSASMLVRADIKRVLAASTMGQMGFMMMQCGLGAIAHAVYHLAAHGLFKATLFLGAGSNVAPQRSRRKPRPGVTVAAALGGIGLVTLVQALATGQAPSLANPSTLLMIFAVLAGAQTLGTLPPQVGRLGESLQIAALMTAFAGLYAAGLGLTRLALGPDANVTAIAAGPLHWAVGAVFAALWIAQLLVVAGGRSLPPRLYGALLSVGRAKAPDLQAALHATGRGSSRPTPGPAA